MDGRVDGWRDGWGGWVDGRVDGADGWMDGWMDGWVDGMGWHGRLQGWVMCVWLDYVKSEVKTRYLRTRFIFVYCTLKKGF